MGELKGKVVMISGTAGGQGRAAALAFARAGALVFGCDVKNDAADETVAMVTAAGGTMQSLHPVDMSEMSNAEAWVRATLDAFGAVDVLYNNAGSLRGRSSFGETTLDEWEQALRYELTMAFVCTRADHSGAVGIGGKPWTQRRGRDFRHHPFIRSCGR